MVIVLDNGGATCDRYTVVIDDSVFGMSENAIDPNGYDQYVGELSELPRVRDEINESEVRLIDLSKQALVAIVRRMIQLQADAVT